MQILDTQIPPSTGTLSVHSSEHTAKPSMARTAAKWAGRALDPRGSVKLIGRGGAALAALALQAPRAAAVSEGGGARGGDEFTSSGVHTYGRYCSEFKDFISPNSSALYALKADCDSVQTYVNRFVHTCGAVATNALDATGWTQLNSWSDTVLYRQNSTADARDMGFVGCLGEQVKAQDKHDQTVSGIILGSIFGGIFGGIAVVWAVSTGVQWCVRIQRHKREAKAAQAAYDATHPEAAHVAIEMQLPA